MTRPTFPEEEQARRGKGIPLHREVVGWFDRITGEIGLEPLARAS